MPLSNAPKRRARAGARVGSPGLAALFVFAAVLLSDCATPMAPGGGPVDATPPALLSTEPPTNTVNFAERELVFLFSERIDGASFQRALHITPEPELPPKIGTKRSRVTVRFQTELRDSTTYIFTLDNTLKDLHGVSLKAPITVAVATGPVIDKGRLVGEVWNPETDKPVASLDVFAYAAPDSTAPNPLDQAPDFRTQTGSDGRFTFEYLPERLFFVAGLGDRNRNRKPDAGEPFAVPPTPAMAARPDSLMAPFRTYLTQLDTTAPEVRRLRTLTSRRLQVRYSEPVRLLDRNPAAWALTDSISGQPATIRSVFSDPVDPTVVVLLTDSLADGTYLLLPAAVADTAGMPSAPSPISTSAQARADTARVRFLGFIPEPPPRKTDSIQVLAPNQWPGVRFSQPPDSALLATLVTVRDTTGAPVALQPVTEDGTRYFLHAPQALKASQRLVVSVQDPPRDTTFVRRFDVLPLSERGEITGVVASAERPVVIEARPGDRKKSSATITTSPDSSGAFRFGDLPEGPYYLRAYVDRDENRSWGGGRLYPYAPYEPLVWYGDSLLVRPRWSTSPPDTLNFSAPGDRSPSPP